jgi:signal transduction histidine kinase
MVYIAASSVYAALIFLGVHATYGIELGRSGVRLPDPQALLTSIDVVGVAVWLGLSIIAGIVLFRMTRALEGARDAGEQQRGDIASIFALGQALSGSLDLETIADRFLAASKDSLDPSVTTSLYVLDDAAGAFTRIGERGPQAGKIGGGHYSASALPAPVRTRVVDHLQALLISDTAGNEAWGPLGAGLTDSSWVRSFAALPLVSHDRLVGIAFFASGRAGAMTADGLQLISLITQFVASAVRTALTFREAQARANRQQVVTRVAQRARASLDPDEVLRATVEELGKTLDVQRVVAVLGTRPDDLRVAQEWNAPGVAPLGLGSSAVPASRIAAASGKTAQLVDDMSRLATPIVVAGELAGALALHADPSREWSTDDVRLVEGVARELRVSMESARLFQARAHENERLLALQRASAIVAARSTTREVIDEVMLTAASLLGQASASLYLWDEAVGALRLAQNADPDGRTVSPVLSRGEGMSGDLLAKLEPIIVNDYASWSGASATGLETKLHAVLGVPLIRSGKLLGAIVLRAYDDRTRFTIEDARLLGLFGDQAVAALTNAEAFERQRAAMEQLERVNRAKSEFVSIVSHEFRTPLTGIQGFSEMMRDEDLPLADMKEYAADINKDAQRLNRMINEMLDLDRMEAGRMTLNRESTDLNGIVSEAADRVRPGAPGHPIRLALEPGMPALSGDKDKLTQVVANLLSNAVKYSPTGGQIVVTTALEASEIHLTVQDKGMGIPADMLEAIWERYARVDSDASRGIQGTGLGLPIVRQIVTMHGGRVWAESEVGRGSLFHVVLPLAADSQAVEA